MRLLHAFQSVERVIYAPDLVRKENDVEHSYLLTLFCWYLLDSLRLPFSKEKVLSYALAHDLPEVYAGDTYIFDPEGLKTKDKREEKARKRLSDEFPEFEDLHKTIDAYEKKEDAEAVFVHAVDKLIPIVTNYIQGGRIWKDMAVPHKELFANKRLKIGNQEEVRELLEQLIADMDARLSYYFTH